MAWKMVLSNQMEKKQKVELRLGKAPWLAKDDGLEY